MKVLICFLSLYLITFQKNFGQSAIDTNDYLPNVTLDSITVTSANLDVPSFIRFIKNDTSFYKAFKNMRFVTFNSIQHFKAYNKKHKETASQDIEVKQIFRDNCRTMHILEEAVDGDFYNQDKTYNYYTAELFASIFHTRGKICNESKSINQDFNTKGLNGIEKRKMQLKQLIFNPGSRVDDIPFFGKKSSIFTENMIDKYQYKISDDTKNGFACYKFDATPLQNYKNDVVINRITTWFRKSDFAIISRNYNLSYHGMGYDFQVFMHVNLTEINGKLYPTFIEYNGNWHISTKKREIVKYTSHFYY